MNDASPTLVRGHAAPGFETVRAAFAANFARDDAYCERGAALAVMHRGCLVVDLYGGYIDSTQARPWERDTLVNVYSTTKGVVALAVAMLVDEGKLAYADRVTRWWSELGAAGKEDTTVAQLLTHQAGLTGFLEPTTAEQLADWNGCCAKLARQAPFWPPGEQTSYHAMTWGYLVGEVFRRAAGMSVGQYIAQRLRAPLRADVFVGVPSNEEGRVSPMFAPRTAPDLSALTQPPQALAALVNPQLDPEIPNQRSWRAAEIPAANGHASALGLARIYAAMAGGGELDGVRVISRQGIDRMLARTTGRTDLLLGFQDNWAHGMSFNQFNMLGPHVGTFGHAGWGGSVGCADPGTGIAIGYVCNQMGADLVGDPRAAGLCAAVFAAVD